MASISCTHLLTSNNPLTSKNGTPSAPTPTGTIAATPIAGTPSAGTLTEAQRNAPAQPKCLRALFKAVRSTEITMRNHTDWQRRSPPLAPSVCLDINDALSIGQEYFLDIHITLGSRKQRDTAVSRWIAYCHVLGIDPILTTFADTIHLRNYIYFLGATWTNKQKSRLGLAHQTVAGHISAIRQWTVERGFQNILEFDKVTPKILKGLRRFDANDSLTSLPLPRTVVNYMIKTLRRSNKRHHPKDHAVADAFQIMFSFLLHVSEIAKTPSKATFLLQGDVTFDTIKQAVTIGLRTTKSSQFQTVYRSLPHIADGDIYTAMFNTWNNNHAYAVEHGLTPAQEAALPFINVNGIPLTREDIALNVTHILTSAATREAYPQFPDPTRYSTHSFRKGGATALLAAGVDIATIKFFGRWRSMAWLLYAQVSDASLARAARALAMASI